MRWPGFRPIWACCAGCSRTRTSFQASSTLASSGGTLALKPHSFELRDRGAVSLVDASGSRDGDEFAETLRVVMGLGDGRVKELWIDPVDRESFGRAFGG